MRVWWGNGLDNDIPFAYDIDTRSEANPNEVDGDPYWTR